MPESPRALLSAPSWFDGVGEPYAEFVRNMRGRTRSADEARELVHDTWLRLAEHDSADQARSPAYAHRVAERLAIDRFRRDLRGMERFIRVEAEDAARLATAPDVATVHAHREALQAVDNALRALPARSRTIFLADRLDGTSHQDLAAQHGVSVKTVEREVMLGLDAIEVALRRWRGEPDDTPARRGRRRALSALLGFAGTGVTALASWQAWRRWVPEFGTVLATATGRMVTRLLPDGSTVTLDASTQAEVAFFAARRTVRLLSGSAFFEVARDTHRPFIVMAATHRVQVLGTRFEVALQAGGGLRVDVQSGSVQVHSALGEDCTLGAGQGVVIDTAHHMSIHSQATQAVASWREGWIAFDPARLDDVVARLSRYVARPVRVSPDVAAMEVFGRVHVADSLSWLQLLPASLPVRTRDDPRDGALLLTR